MPKPKLNVVVTWMSHIMHDCANEYYNLVYRVEHLLNPRPFQKIGSRLKSKKKIKMTQTKTTFRSDFKTIADLSSIQNIDGCKVELVEYFEQKIPYWTCACGGHVRLEKHKSAVWIIKTQTIAHRNYLSVSRFQEKEKRGEMMTINDNIKL